LTGHNKESRDIFF